MKIRGYIDYRYPAPAPFIRALVLFRELRIEAALSLIIDTGASNTLILWKDILRLAVDPLRVIGEEREFVGIGGAIRSKQTRAIVEFTAEHNEVVKEETQIFITSSPCPHPRLMLLPSILGRDILNKYGLIYKLRTNEVYLEK